MSEVRTGELTVDGVRSPLIEAGPGAAAEAVFFVHGNPGSSEDWRDLVAEVGEFGRAIAPDMPGFGRADKPQDFDYRIEGYAQFIQGALQQLGVEKVHLVVHDFGGPFGFAWAASDPEAFASAVLFNTGSVSQRKWHVMARIWRTPVLGELSMALTNRPAWRRALGAGASRPLPAAFIDRMYDDYDRGTQNAVLKLYRATDVPYPGAEKMAATIRERERPAHIVWGARDPFIGRGGADALRGDLFPRAELTMLEDSGHWPFVDDPERARPPALDFLRAQLTAGAPA
jgi:pimeloyl-ACP methyl ester carboxylesterase